MRFVARDISSDGTIWVVDDTYGKRALFLDQLPATKREADMCARAANRAAAAVLEHIESQVGAMVKELRDA